MSPKSIKTILGIAAIVGILVIALGLLSASLNPLFPIDDAYTCFRYARNWAEGAGLVFNAGERVEAQSNFLWTMLVGLLRLFGLTEPLGARILALLAVTLTSLLVLWTVRRRLPASPRVLAFAVGATYLLLPGTIFHALSGMETVLTGLLLITAAAAFDADIPVSRRSWTMGLVLALISLNRPEGLVLFGLVLVASVAVPVFRREPRPIAVLPLIVSYAVIVLPFLTWRLFYYGSLIPNSIVAKGGTYNLPIIQAGLEYGLRFVVFYSPLLILSAVSFGMARTAELVYLRLPILCTYAALVVLGGVGDGYPFSRYIYPLVPLLLVWSVEGLSAMMQIFRRDGVERKVSWLSSFVLVAVVASCQLTLSRTEYRTSGIPFGLHGAGPRARLAGFFAQDTAPHDISGPLRQLLGHHRLAAWLQAHASPDQLLATYEIGIVPYYSRLRVLDLYGLASREIARSDGWPGQRAKPAYIASRHPDYLVLRLPADSLSMPLPIFSDEHRREDYDLIQQFQYSSTEILLLKRR